MHTSQAHVIEKLVLYGTNGSVVATYTTSNYQSNPNGFYSNRWWPGGVGTIFAGLIISYVALFVRRKKRPAAPIEQTAAAGTWPYEAIPPYPTTSPTKLSAKS